SRDAALAETDRQIAVLAHDLRNPLGTLKNGLLMLRRSESGPAATRTLDRLDRAADRMGGMIRDLLDFARAGAGTMSILPAPMDLGVLCREVLEEFETADPNGKIELTLDGDLSGEWDRARLYQSLSNLVGNATHYGRGRAEVGVRGLDEHVELVVHNGGPPIPKERLPVIFRPFERGQEDGTGLGLGLYIVDAITRAHGGTVQVASSEASGTTFTLRVPRRPVAPVHATAG
ncbi:MAG: sensory box histidine kinase, partial [Myxococcales bacterium]|nr:sensory box histidine kinase [Myxococcales bacterium]